MKVAVFGCLHGMLDEMYRSVEQYEQESAYKYKKVGDFHDYYAGRKKIPKLTIFVGGNHEASNYLMTLPYGGWVCDNFYYLGYAGVVRYKGLRIAGVSGIYNFRNCSRGRYESMPLDDQSIKSVYHTRRLDIFRLQLLSANAKANDPIDAFLSHDWPARIYDYGNKEQLLRFKPHFRSDIESRDGLGSPLTQPLVDQLRPKRWFAAHLHCRFFAKVNHDSGSRSTEFLSLNKIENRRNFMEVVDFEQDRDFDDSDDFLYHDEEWLTILRKTKILDSDSKNNVFCPSIDDGSGQAYIPKAADIEETINIMNKTGGLRIEKNFKMVEPVIYNRPNHVQPSMDPKRVRSYTNPLTDEFESRLFGREQINRPDTSGDVKPKAEVIPTRDVGLKNEPVSGFKKKLEHDGKRVKREDDDDGCLPFYIDTKGDR